MIVYITIFLHEGLPTFIILYNKEAHESFQESLQEEDFDMNQTILFKGETLLSEAEELFLSYCK